MAQTFTAAAMGNAANDGSGNSIREGGLKIAADLAELYGAVAALQAGSITLASIIRGESGKVYTGPGVLTVTFATDFVSAYEIFINTTEGIGYTISNKGENGFDIEFLEACTFSYVCIAITT
jgi:hypothetical protein